MSFNLWNYGHSNPIIFVDPTGHFRCFTDSERLETAEKYVQRGDELATYTAAGIAVQCRGSDMPRPGDEDNSGIGIGQISNNQAKEAYGNIVIGNRGAGVRCYLKAGGNDDGSCSLCYTDKEMKDRYGKDYLKYFKLEHVHDQTDGYWAQLYMRRRIKLVYDACKANFCNEKDKFIVSALAQNGPGFTSENVPELHNRTNFNKDENRIDWQIWWWDRSIDSKREYSLQLRLFYKFAMKLNKDGYYLPPSIQNDYDIHWIMGFHYN